MKYMKEALNEVAMNKDNVHEFIKFAKNALQLKEKVSVKLLEKRHENMTAACYDPNTNEISIYTKGRAYADVCRSIAHELVHQKQNELGVLKLDSGQTGSDIENEAHSVLTLIHISATVPRHACASSPAGLPYWDSPQRLESH